MNVRSAVLLGLKALALTTIMFVSFGIASAVTGQVGESPEHAGTVLMTLLLVCFLNTAVLTYPVLRSRWTGWRLIATVFFVFYGVMTVMSQIESAVFLSSMLPPGTLPKLFLLGAVVAGLFSPLAVLILGRVGARRGESYISNRLVMPRSEWVWKLIAIVVGYLFLYYTFGYFVAWQSPAVREYYAQVEIPSWLPFFQALRALMWTALALPVIRMMEGQWWEAALAVGLLFAVLMNSQLLLPNPYMPEAVRMAHLVETASSNFIFGWLIVWLLNRHHASLRELFKLSEG